MQFMMTITYMFFHRSTNLRESTKTKDFSFVFVEPSGVDTHRELYFMICILLYFIECNGCLIYWIWEDARMGNRKNNYFLELYVHVWACIHSLTHAHAHTLSVSLTHSHAHTHTHTQMIKYCGSNTFTRLTFLCPSFDRIGAAWRVIPWSEYVSACE